jgi:hypothetical protein
MNSKAILLAVLGLVLLSAPVAGAQTHCSQLPRLTPDASFPRCTDQQLATVGFPDPMHAYTWRDWELLVDAEGQTYGPKSMCEWKALTPREGLIVEPDQKKYRNFVLRHNPGYSKCDMIQFIELLDWANHDIPALIGLSNPDTLKILNPDNVDEFRKLTGLGVWRFYALDGNECIMQPWPTLMARTLDAHAAFMLVTDWILRKHLATDLPPWLHYGLMEYLSEDGVHLLSYMNEFREDGPVLLTPDAVNALFAAGVDPDEAKDREGYRKACYTSFLMVWQLVENEGGLTALRDFLDLAVAGSDLDQASRTVYGMDLRQLAAYLDPAKNGEPAPYDPSRPRPHREP